MSKVGQRVDRMMSRLEVLLLQHGLGPLEMDGPTVTGLLFAVVAEEIEASKLTGAQLTALSGIETIGGVYNGE